jgi:signal transduction histidine kinase
VQRRRIQHELHLGAGRRLENVAALFAQARRSVVANDAEAIAGVETELAEARHELEEFAHSVLPAPLTDEGLLPAVTVLARRSGIPVEVKGSVGRLPEPLEAALFYVCSEALANVIKHAAASHATIGVRAEGERVVVEVADDGVGGARPSRGSGLVGLADRVEALGGTLRVASPRGGGTRIVAELPVPR